MGDCSVCGGLGWHVRPERHPSCDGNCDQCPIPIQVQCDCQQPESTEDGA